MDSHAGSQNRQVGRQRLGRQPGLLQNREKEMSIGQMFDEHSRKLVIPVGPLLKWGGDRERMKDIKQRMDTHLLGA